MEWNHANEYKQQITIYGVIQGIQAAENVMHFPFPAIGKHSFLGRVGKDNRAL